MPTILLVVDLDPLDALDFSPDNGTATLADDNPGYKVQIYRNGTAVGRATPVPAQPGMFTFTFTSALSEGLNFIAARVVIVDDSDNPAAPGTADAVGQGGESEALVVTLDTTAPDAGALGQLDLLDSSDSGGINDDNVTTFSTPSFGIQVNEPGLVRVYAQPLPAGPIIQVAQFNATTTGIWQVTVQSLSDGVYNMTATIEDGAGNVAAGQVDGQRVAVRVDVHRRNAGDADQPRRRSADEALGRLRGEIDDSLTYTPATADAGSLALAGVAQTINFANASALTVNALGGDDTVTTITVKVGTTMTLGTPAAQTEKVGISTLQGSDTIAIDIYDTVNAALFVDGGEPTTVNKGNDVLNLFDKSAGKKGTYSNISGGSTAGAGAVELTFKAAGTATRVDYVNVEKVTRK
jgi:hypothetical protein